MQLIDCREMTKCHQKSCFPPFRKTNSKFCFHFLNQNTGNNLLPLRELGAAGPIQRRSRTRSSPAPRLLLRRCCNRSFLPQRQRPDDQSEMYIKPEQDLSLLYSQGNPQGCSRLSRRQHPSDYTITMGQNKSQHHPVLQPHHALGGWLCRHGDTGHQLSNLAQTRMLAAGFCFGFFCFVFVVVAHHSACPTLSPSHPQPSQDQADS